MKKEQVLIVEDDADIRDGVRILLESEGYAVMEAEDGRQGLYCLNDEVDLVILDVMMPGMSGLRTCEEIRKISNVPELLGRVKALLRRYNVYRGRSCEWDENENSYLTLNGIKIHEKFNEVYIDGVMKDMSDIEYHILLLMMQHAGKIFSAQNLYESVWQEPYFYSCNSTVMVHIRKLRVKIEDDPKNPKYIKTVWGKGYKFDTDSK